MEQALLTPEIVQDKAKFYNQIYVDADNECTDISDFGKMRVLI